VNSTVPAYAQFRFCPYDYAGQLPLSTATNFQFRFPLKSVNAPTITMSSPAGTSISNSGTLPWRQLFAGTVTDVASNLVEVEITASAPGESSPRIIADYKFSLTGSFTFSKYIPFDKPGSWTIAIIARDADGLVTTLDIAANITGVAKCAFPELEDTLGNLITDVSGNYVQTTAQAAAITGVNTIFSPSAVAWTAAPAQFFPFAPWTLVCTTPGATINYATSGIRFYGGTLHSLSSGGLGGLTYSTFVADSNCPFHMLIDPATVAGGTGVGNVSGVLAATYYICAYATAPGYATSDPVKWTIPLFI